MSIANRDGHTKMWSLLSSCEQAEQMTGISSLFASTVFVGSHEDTSFGMNRRLNDLPLVLHAKESQSMELRVVFDHSYLC